MIISNNAALPGVDFLERHPSSDCSSARDLARSSFVLCQVQFSPGRSSWAQFYQDQFYQDQFYRDQFYQDQFYQDLFHSTTYLSDFAAVGQSTVSTICMLETCDSSVFRTCTWSICTRASAAANLLPTNGPLVEGSVARSEYTSCFLFTDFHFLIRPLTCAVVKLSILLPAGRLFNDPLASRNCRPWSRSCPSVALTLLTHTRSTAKAKTFPTGR